jgi:hypothetical protein
MKDYNGMHQCQRMYQITEDTVCEWCGSKRLLQRHHLDRNCSNNDKSNVVILCQDCHTKTHVERGEWGRKHD